MPIRYVTWDEVSIRCASIASQLRLLKEKIYLYGVPRGGCAPAALVCSHLREAGCDVELLDAPDYTKSNMVVIDDLIDSGITERRFVLRGPCVFYALFNKTKEGLQGTWLVFPWEGEETTPTDAVVRLLTYIGEDPNREGLRETPNRVIKSYGELFAGYKINAASLMTVFEDGACDEMVVLRDIEFQSCCEHHMLPFIGMAHVAYVPNKRVIGVSKLARLVDMFAKRLQIQERICQQVTSALDEHLAPHGSACVIEAKHLCMSCRGVGKQNSKMVTSSLTGVFRSDSTARAEFMSLISR